MASFSDSKATGVVDVSAAAARARQPRSSTSINYATATMRVSVSDTVNVHGKERHSVEKNIQENAIDARKQRRKSTLMQMGVASSVMKDAALDALKDEVAAASEAAGDVGPVGKLQALLTKAKEKGMSAERLFEHFAPNGEASVTPKMFEIALRKLAHRAFDLDEMDLEHLVTVLDTGGNGTIELDEFMTFCLSIPSLPWRAEKARRLNNAESKDGLNVAARKLARRRSSLKAIPIGKLVHQESRFYWRSKENIDVAFHLNSDEGLVTISTRSPERGYNYPAIFVDTSKIPVNKSEAAARANSVGQFDAMNQDERVEATNQAMTALRIEYLQHRLKVPDEANLGDEGGPGVEALAESEDSSTSSGEEPDEKGESSRGGGKAAATNATGGGSAAVPTTTTVPWMTKPGDMTPQERADDKAKHRPFLVKLSTDKWDTLLCTRNIVLQTPHRFAGAARRSSMEDFRRTSLEFAQLAKETEALSTMAETKSREVDVSISSLAEASNRKPT